MIGCRELFRQVSAARIGPEIRDKLLYPLDKSFHGKVDRREASYCFIARDGQNDWIYAHRKNIAENVWKLLVVGTRMTFQIAFTLRGPNAFNVQTVGEEARS